jgi:hypothetical protein
MIENHKKPSHAHSTHGRIQASAPGMLQIMRPEVADDDDVNIFDEADHLEESNIRSMRSSQSNSAWECDVQFEAQSPSQRSRRSERHEDQDDGLRSSVQSEYHHDYGYDYDIVDIVGYVWMFVLLLLHYLSGKQALKASVGFCRAADLCGCLSETCVLLCLVRARPNNLAVRQRMHTCIMHRCVRANTCTEIEPEIYQYLDCMIES